MEIRPIKLGEIMQARGVVLSCVQEFFGVSEGQMRKYDTLSDIDEVETHYFGNKGIFLVTLDGERVVGTGAVRRLDDEVAELKRMYLLPEYRGRGLGMKMAMELLVFAKAQDYRCVRLDVGTEEQQPQAFNLYRKLGFTLIESYNKNSLARTFMEKVL